MLRPAATAAVAALPRALGKRLHSHSLGPAGAVAPLQRHRPRAVLPPAHPLDHSFPRSVSSSSSSTSSSSSSGRWPLPQVPSTLYKTVDEAIVRQLVPSEAILVESCSMAEEVFPELLSSPILGVDCEGVSLGRWGRLCLCQISTAEHVYLFDALREGMMDILKPVLESDSVVKVMHDCREDASALLSQFGVELRGIYDTQVAHTMLLEQVSTRPFQISLNELLKSVLQLENEKQVSLGEVMKEDPNVWFYRPMHLDLITYAAQDAMYLPLLHRAMCEKLGDVSGGLVMERSLKYSDYARMNLHLGSPKAAEKRGLRLQGMVATRTENALYLKLNLGAQRQGAVSRSDALSRFHDLKFGDIADCWVSAWNMTGNILFLERLEPGHSIPEPRQDLTGLWKGRKARRPRGPRDG